MTDKSGLEERLLALAAAGLGEPGGRQLRGSNAKLLLRRIVGEIDYAVMPRRVVIESPAGREAHLDVANRRLLRIEAGLGHPALERLTGTAPDKNAEGQAEALRVFFEALVEGAKSVRIRFDTSKTAFDPTQSGISTETLSQALGVSTDPADQSEPAVLFDSFLSKIQEDAMAWVLMLDGEREASGDPDALELLETALAGLADPEPNATSWTMLALRPATSGPGFAVALDLGGARLGMAVPPDRMGHLTDAWRATLDS